MLVCRWLFLRLMLYLSVSPDDPELERCVRFIEDETSKFENSIEQHMSISPLRSGSGPTSPSPATFVSPESQQTERVDCESQSYRAPSTAVPKPAHVTQTPQSCKGALSSLERIHQITERVQATKTVPTQLKPKGKKRIDASASPTEHNAATMVPCRQMHRGVEVEPNLWCADPCMRSVA